MRIFLAGASGAIGRRLVPLLRDAGHSVAGTTRSPAKAEELRALGAEPVIVAEPNPHIATDKARAGLGWDAAFRNEQGAGR
jgi:uncharacterized protein YbjT (DUF2867 family)